MGTTSGNGEREIGELITKAVDKIGKEGVITVVVSKNTIKNLAYLALYQSYYLFLLLFFIGLGIAG